VDKKISTLCIVHKNDEILLGKKKRGLGNNRWNGFGGKVKIGENVEKAARRELEEESGIIAKKVEKFGKIVFNYKHTDEIWEVNIFKTSDFTGEIMETEEMKPQWFDIKNIPYDSMWPDDKFWLPLFLEGKKFRGKFLFDDYNKIVEHKIEVVETF